MRAVPIESAKQVQESLRLVVDPVKVFEITTSGWLRLSRSRMRLIASSERTLASLRLDLGNLAILVSQAEQTTEVRESVLQRAVEREYSPGYFLATRALVILGNYFEVATQQIESPAKMRKPCRARPRMPRAPSSPTARPL